MAAIKSLLNPMPELRDRTLQLPSPTSTVFARDFSPPPQSRKKQKLSKDAAVFTRGTIRGECRFPPYEYCDTSLAAHHQQYEIYPVGNIADYPRHIPYNSEKKSLLERTGRESFEGMATPLQWFRYVLTPISVSLRLQASGGGEGPLHDVGLQHRPCSDYATVQKLRLLQGTC